MYFALLNFNCAWHSLHLRLTAEVSAVTYSHWYGTYLFSRQQIAALLISRRHRCHRDRRAWWWMHFSISLLRFDVTTFINPSKAKQCCVQTCWSRGLRKTRSVKLGFENRKRFNNAMSWKTKSHPHNGRQPYLTRVTWNVRNIRHNPTAAQHLVYRRWPLNRSM